MKLVQYELEKEIQLFSLPTFGPNIKQISDQIWLQILAEVRNPVWVQIRGLIRERIHEEIRAHSSVG